MYYLNILGRCCNCDVSQEETQSMTRRVLTKSSQIKEGMKNKNVISQGKNMGTEIRESQGRMK